MYITQHRVFLVGEIGFQHGDKLAGIDLVERLQEQLFTLCSSMVARAAQRERLGLVRPRLSEHQ
jgi:hypothetical protein